MQHITPEQTKAIADKTGLIIETLNQGIAWAEHKQPALAFDLKGYRRKMKKIRSAVTGKPVVAFFGASQVGKSYMVNSLLCDDSKKLSLADSRDTNKKMDFIKDINPEGRGNESTSVVTRFTTDRPPAGKPPIKVKLLSAKGLICLLCDSYFSDIAKKNTAKYEERMASIMQLKSGLAALCEGNPHEYLHEDDVYDIWDYLESHFGHSDKDYLSVFDSTGYWHEAARCIAHIQPDKWTRVFSVLWNNNPVISKHFSDLIRELAGIDFSSFVYADFDAVVRDYGAILDVTTLDDLLSGKEKMIEIVTPTDKNARMSNARLCALCEEVVFWVEGNYQSDSKPYESALKTEITKHIDVLDFPGARSRLRLSETDIEEMHVKEIILRGKVSYLFNSYSANYEINNLFVCMRTEQTNVRIVPSLVNNWIEFNVGKTPKERYQTLQDAEVPPLFVIFTWWNTLLGFNVEKDSGDPSDRIEKWLKTRFDEEILGDYTWNAQWTEHNGRPEAFHNYFLLRDFMESYNRNKVFGRRMTREMPPEYEEVEHDEISPENRSRKDYLKRFKEAFVQSPLVRRFFRDPEERWNASSVCNKDGSVLILENIRKVANNQTRTGRYLGLLSDWTSTAYAMLKALHHGDDAGENLLKSIREAAHIRNCMHRVFGMDAYNFGNFIEHLMMTEEEIVILYHEKLLSIELEEKSRPAEYIHYIEASPRLNAANSYEQNVRILQEDNYLDKSWNTAEVESYFLKKYKLDIRDMLRLWNKSQEKKSYLLTQEAVQMWFRTKLSVGHFAHFVDLGFDKAALELLLDSMKTRFLRLNMDRRIAEKISRYVDRIERLDVAEDMIAHVTSSMINNFVTSWGWEYYDDAAVEKLHIANNQLQPPINIPSRNGSFESAADLDELFGFMANLDENLRDIHVDNSQVQKVPMINHYKRWREMIQVSFLANCETPTYDVEENRRLGDILSGLAGFDFAIG